MLARILLCFAVLIFCGCLENKGEFDALNLGKVSAIYENGALKMVDLGNLSPQDSAPFILFFFTTTCGVCKAQIPILQEMASENTKIYGILGNAPSVEKARAYAQESAITLPIFYESNARRFFTQIVGGVKGVPVIAIFGKDGKIKERFIGLTPKGILKAALAKT